MVSEGSKSKVMVFPVRVFTNSCCDIVGRCLVSWSCEVNSFDCKRSIIDNPIEDHNGLQGKPIAFPEFKTVLNAQINPTNCIMSSPSPKATPSEPTSRCAITVSDEKTFDTILEKLVLHKKWAIVKFSATWCGPCRSIAPYFVGLAPKQENKEITFLQVDVDDLGDVAARYNVSVMPTFLAIFDKKQAGPIVRGADKAGIEKLLEYVRSAEAGRSAEAL